jgi:hypothetical protein
MLERARHNIYKILESFDCLPSINVSQYETMRNNSKLKIICTFLMTIFYLNFVNLEL